MRAKDLGIGLTYVSSLDYPVGADEEGCRQTANRISITCLAVTIEQNS